jgi:hypothetical protein
MRNFFFTVAVAAVFAAGCGSHDQNVSSDARSPAPPAFLPPGFAFIRTNLDIMTLEEVTNRVGSYTRVGRLRPDEDALAYEFDLKDGSAVILIPERPYQARNRVHMVQYFVSTNEFRLYP